MILIPISLWYLFMITLSFKAMEKLHIGFDKWWYGTELTPKEHSLIWATGAFFGSIVWPLTWIIIGMSKASKKILDKVEQELKGDSNE